MGTLAAPPGGGAGGPVSGAHRGCSWADRASYPAAWPRKQVVGVDGAMWGPQHHCPGGPVSPSPSITARGSSSPSITVPGSCLPLPRITVLGVRSPPPQHHCPRGPVSPSPASLSRGSSLPLPQHHCPGGPGLPLTTPLHPQHHSWEACLRRVAVWVCVRWYLEGFFFQGQWSPRAWPEDRKPALVLMVPIAS